LPFKEDTTQAELPTEAFFIHGFQEAGSKNSVHLDSGPYDGSSQLIDVIMAHN